MRDTMKHHVHPKLEIWSVLYETLESATVEAVRALQRRRAVRPRNPLRRAARPRDLRRRAATPLWDDLAAVARSRLTRYGDQAHLARLLGVPRQRVHEYLVTRTARPDAEETLRLLAWLASDRHAPRDKCHSPRDTSRKVSRRA